MTQEEKRALKNKWRAEQNRKLVLSKTNAAKLFRFLGRRIDAEGCDETLRFTEQWLEEHMPEEKRAAVLAEIRGLFTESCGMTTLASLVQGGGCKPKVCKFCLRQNR